MPQLSGWNVRVFGSDLSTAAVARARRFRYSDLEVQRGSTPQQLRRHFRPVDDGWELMGRARERLSWFQMNLMDTWSLPARPDVIFMRNVLIYFDTPTKKRMIERARQALAADGILFLGGAETPMELDDDGWERVTRDKSSCYVRRT